jgi:protoporphyrinogen oxidase
MKEKKKIVIIGAGPSGLSVSWGLAEKEDFETTILERSDTVGGLARTITHKGISFDIGPHRLSPQLPEIVEAVRGLLGPDLLERKNIHGVYLRENFYHYPPGLKDFLNFSSLMATLSFGFSWAVARITDMFKRGKGTDDDRSFDLLLKRYFGNKFYCEVIVPMIHKVWGTDNLHHEFAKIRFVLPKFSMMIRKIFIKGSKVNDDIFHYPVKGFSQIWDSIAAHLEANDQTIERNALIESIEADSLKGPFNITYMQNEERKTVTADTIVSSISNEYLLDYLKGTGLVTPLLKSKPTFKSRTLRLGVLSIKGFTLPARVIIFPEDRFIFNRVSEMNQFADLGYPKDHSILMIDVIMAAGSEYDLMGESEFNKLLLDSFLTLGWCKETDVASIFSLRFPGAYPVLTLERYEAQEAIEKFFTETEIYLCGREASTDYNNAHNAVGKGFLTARYLAGELDYDEFNKDSTVMGRLPIQD